MQSVFRDPLKNAKQAANALLDASLVDTEQFVGSLFDEREQQDVYVTDTLLQDSGLEKYVQNVTTTKGAGHYLWHHMKQLSSDINVLQHRQSPSLPPNLPSALKLLTEGEANILWLFTVPPLPKAWPLNLLFPTAMGLKLINRFDYLLEGFHLYRCFVAPWMNIITPITTIFGPWVYIRKTFKWMVSLKAYCNLLFKAFGAGFKVTGNLRNDLTRVVSIMAYIILFIYTTVQSFETAAMLRKIRKDINNKLSSIRKFISTAIRLVAETPTQVFAAWGVNKNDIMTDVEAFDVSKHSRGMYNLLTDKGLQERLKKLIAAVYVLDISAWSRSLVDRKVCVPVTYTNDPGSNTLLWNMGHILLDDKQVRNPLSMNKNIIITGPNAAGKTTYVRSLLTNVLLSQSLGIACASKAIVRPVNVIGTFIRVSDTLGKLSLFEAEAQRCAKIINKAKLVAERGQAGVFFLDEPMHSTPPTEGMATCRAVLEHLATMPGIRTITTTHYHQVTDLAKELPNSFANLSMNAIPLEDGFHFPYRIVNGASCQCIALELLKDHQLPYDVIVRAIQLKNKLAMM